MTLLIIYFTFWEMDCNITIFDIIHKYLDYGWIELSNIFTHENTAKQKSIVVGGVNEQLLRMLSCIRTYTVEQIFLCSLKKVRGKVDDVKYTAYGSTNVTSDYDITVTGRKAPEIMINMFHEFLRKYDDLLPQMFDTNVYCAGMYSINGLRPSIKNMQRLKGSDIGILVSRNDTDDATQQCFAALGLVESGMLCDDYRTQSKLFELLQKAKELEGLIKKLYDKEKTKQLKIFKSKNADTIDIIVKYQLAYIHAKKLFRLLYVQKNKNDVVGNIIYLACLSQYFSIESYYTPATFNIVVMHLQAKKKGIKLSKSDYLCATLENLGHFRKHTSAHKNNKKQDQAVLLKNSKYLYRMYYSLVKYLGSKHPEYKSLSSFVEVLKVDVIPFRSSIDSKVVSSALKKIDFTSNLVKYVKKHTLNVTKNIK